MNLFQRFIISRLAVGLDKLDDLNGGLGNVGHILSVRELSQKRRRSDDDINAIDTYEKNSGTRARTKVNVHAHQSRLLSVHRPCDTEYVSKSLP